MQLLYALFALDLLNLAVFLPVFSPFVTSIGGTPFILGLINSSSALISLLWNPVVGSLSDQVGRKGLLLKCILASAIGSLLMASSSSLLIVFVGKLIGALGSSVQILLRSIVADTYKTADEKKTFFNKCAPVMSLAFLVGSVSSGFLSEAKHGYSLAFLVMATCMGLAAFIANKAIKTDTKTNKKSDQKSTFASDALKELKSAAINIKSIPWPRYKHIFIVKGLYDLSIATLFANVGLLLVKEFQIKGRTIGFVFMMISVCRILSNILKLRLKSRLDKISDQKKLVFGGLVLVVSYIGMWIVSPFSVYLVLLCTACITRAFMDTTFTEIIATRTTTEDRGKVIGAFDNLYSFAMFIAPLVSAFLAEALGQRMLIGTAAIPIGVAVYVARLEQLKTE